MDIVSRKSWNARPPRTSTTVNPSRREFFVVHHSGGPVTQTVRAIQDWCMNAPPHGRGFSDIDYNFLVRADNGEIYEGRGWDVVGAHTTGYNTTGAGVCIIGTDQVSDAAKLAVRWLHQQYNRRAGHTLKIRGHRDLATTGTTCPGDHVQAWLRDGMPAPTTQEDDMAINQADFNKLMTGWAASAEGRQALGFAAWAYKLDDPQVAATPPEQKTAAAWQRYSDVQHAKTRTAIAALAARDPAGTGPVTQDQLVAALRTVLGSLGAGGTGA